MTDRIPLRSLSANSINSITVDDVIDNLQGKDGKFNKKSEIKINGESFTLSLDKVGTKLKLQVKKNYASGLKGILQKIVGYRRNVAESLSIKLANVLKSNEFALVNSNINNLRQIARSNIAKGNNVIEVADFGKSKDRRLVVSHRLIDKVEQEFSQQGLKIHFNQIDSYNDLSGIMPSTLSIAPPNKVGSSYSSDMQTTLNKIKSGTLELKGNQHINNEQLQAWTNFLSKAENFKKIDIVSKLNEYLHMDKNTVAEKSTGWKAEFLANPEKALKNFIVKNLSGYFDGVPEDVKNQTYTDVKNYLDIMYIKDEKERNLRLGEFFKDQLSWLTPEQQESFHKQCDSIKKDNPEMSEDEISKMLLQTGRFQLGASQRYVNLCNVFVRAFFRETSKLGLEFFNSNKVPVLFQYTADDQGTYLSPEGVQKIYHENHNQNGGANVDRDAKYSVITNSELRHANRIASRFNNEFEVKYSSGGQFGIHSN